MREYRDPLGRPIRRLYLKTDLLNRRCEGLMREFMNRRSGGYRLPIPTNELMRLLDERAGESIRTPTYQKEFMDRQHFISTADLK